MATLRSDAEVRHDITEALESDARVDSSRISVDVVEGVVILRGVVSTDFEKRVAEDVARRIKGARDVANELHVVSAHLRSDDQIAADVRAALSHDVWVDDRRVSVDVREGVVYLSGVVDAYAAKPHAESDAWGVDGVVDVVDGISVKNNRSRADDEIKREVIDDLERNLRLAPDSVVVEVQRGTVYLRGTVQNVEQKWLAEEIAWWTAGVRDVVNQLTVGQAQNGAGGRR